MSCYSRKNREAGQTKFAKDGRSGWDHGGPRPFSALSAQLIRYCLVLPLLFLSLSGCAYFNRRNNNPFPPPKVFAEQPQLPQIIEQVNHSLNIVRLQSDNLTVSGPDMPTKLSGKVKWERPYNFRLEAGLPLIGNALSAGSNSEMFWLQTQVPSPPTLYFARHDEFDRQQGPRTILPVSPLWLREAMGVVELDPSMPHQEPIVRPDGRLEVRSMIPSSSGSFRRHIVLNPSTGVIEQTLLYNQSGKLVATAEQSDHRYHSNIDFSLPRRVDIQLLPDGGHKIIFTVQVGFYLINQDTGAIDSFALPEATGLTQVDLTRLNGRPVQAIGAGYQAPPNSVFPGANGVNGPPSSWNVPQGYGSAVTAPKYTPEPPRRRALFDFSRIRR